MYFVYRELFVLVAIPEKEIYSGFTLGNIMYLATAEQEHHSVELSDKTILAKSKFYIHSTVVKTVPGNSTKTKIFLRKILGGRTASFSSYYRDCHLKFYP